MTKTIAKREDTRSVTFTPFGESEEIELSIGAVRNFIAAKTKSGAEPSQAELVKFLMLCKARALNPWVGDAYLVGYDSRDGATFSLITSIQALLKRAEANADFDGLESGVIVYVEADKSRELNYRDGDLVLKGEVLVGGWARCHRKNLSKPFFDALNVEVFDQNFGRWKKDKAGMIVKCAEASVLRSAFATQLGGLYIANEMSENDTRSEIVDAVSTSNAALEDDRPSQRERSEEMSQRGRERVNADAAAARQESSSDSLDANAALEDEDAAGKQEDAAAAYRREVFDADSITDNDKRLARFEQILARAKADETLNDEQFASVLDTVDLATAGNLQ